MHEFKSLNSQSGGVAITWPKPRKGSDMLKATHQVRCLMEIWTQAYRVQGLHSPLCCSWPSPGSSLPQDPTQGLPDPGWGTYCGACGLGHWVRPGG